MNRRARTLTPARIITLIVIGPATAVAMGAAILIANPAAATVYPVTPTTPPVVTATLHGQRP